MYVYRGAGGRLLREFDFPCKHVATELVVRLFVEAGVIWIFQRTVEIFSWRYHLQLPMHSRLNRKLGKSMQRFTILAVLVEEQSSDIRSDFMPNPDL